jgi:beta-lactamase superfamily II metal-dependent hydrolase
MRSKWLILATVAILVLYFIISSTSIAAPANNLQVSFINVGQGDAELIRSADGYEVLIDGGKPSAGPTVVAYL